MPQPAGRAYTFRAMRRFILPLAAAAAAALLVPAAASAKDDLRVFFPGDCVTNEYKPTSIQPFCADAGMPITEIRWQRYGAKSARGSGVAEVNNCKPNCAAGKTRDYAVRVRLTRVRQCGDVPQFTRLRIAFADNRPHAGFRKAFHQSYRCADAPTG